MSNYTTKADLKNATSANKLAFAKKTYLSNLKSDVDKLDIDQLKQTSGLSNLKSKVDKVDIGKLKTTPIDLRKLSIVIKNGVVKKTEYNELIKKVNNINNTGTSKLVQLQNTKRMF